MPPKCASRSPPNPGPGGQTDLKPLRLRRSALQHARARCDPVAMVDVPRATTLIAREATGCYSDDPLANDPLATASSVPHMCSNAQMTDPHSARTMLGTWITMTPDSERRIRSVR